MTPATLIVEMLEARRDALIAAREAPVYSVLVVGRSKPSGTNLGFAEARALAARESYHPLVGARVVYMLDERGEVVETFGRTDTRSAAVIEAMRRGGVT